MSFAEYVIMVLGTMMMVEVWKCDGNDENLIVKSIFA